MPERLFDLDKYIDQDVLDDLSIPFPHIRENIREIVQMPRLIDLALAMTISRRLGILLQKERRPDEFGRYSGGFRSAPIETVKDVPKAR